MLHVLKFGLDVQNVFVLSIFCYEMLADHLKTVVAKYQTETKLDEDLEFSFFVYTSFFQYHPCTEYIAFEYVLLVHTNYIICVLSHIDTESRSEILHLFLS